MIGGAVAGGAVVAEKALGDETSPLDATGTWTYSFTFTDPPVSGSVATLTFALTQTGSAISGTATITLGPPASGTDIRPVNGMMATSSPRVTFDNLIRSNAFLDRSGRPYGLCSERYALDPSADGRTLSGTATKIPDALCQTVSGSGSVTLNRR